MRKGCTVFKKGFAGFSLQASESGRAMVGVTRLIRMASPVLLRAIQLAATLAKQGRRVCLVDAGGQCNILCLLLSPLVSCSFWVYEGIVTDPRQNNVYPSRPNILSTLAISACMKGCPISRSFTRSHANGGGLRTHSADELDARHDSSQRVNAGQVVVTAQLWWRRVGKALCRGRSGE